MKASITRHDEEVSKLEQRIKELEELIQSPDRWLKWCDIKVLERCEALEERIEQLTTQLAGCATAAMGWTKDPAKMGDWGWSVVYQDVLELRVKYDALEAENQRLKDQISHSLRNSG